MSGGVFGVDLEGQASDRTAVAAVGVDEAPPVPIEQRKDSRERIGGRTPRGPHDVRLEQRDVGVEDRLKERVFAVEKVIEAAAVGAGPLEHFGEAGRGIPFFPEQMPRRLHDAFAGVVDAVRSWRHV